MGVSMKLRCGSVVHLQDDGVYYVKTKVIISGEAHFYHEELWSEFPSDHFKTKLLLAAG